MKICFWGSIGNALNGNTDGGGELQLSLMAKALARGGHEVVVLDTNTIEDYFTTDGIKVFKIKGWNNEIRYIRGFTRLLKLYKSLKEQQADIYYCRIFNFRHVLSFWAARKVKAKFVISLASDLEAMNFIMRWKNYYSVNSIDLGTVFHIIFTEIIYPQLFRKADLVLVQHEGQKNILLQKHIKSIVFPNLYDGTINQVHQTHTSEDFVHVGSLRKHKGFDELFKVIKKAPLHKFKIIGQPMDKMAFSNYEKLKTFSNVSLLGRLCHSETLNHISNSKALISTSSMEGFPNVFIEAWACGVPVLSLYVDPGDIIKKENLGEFAHGNIEKLLESMETVQSTNEFSNGAKLYVERNHLLNTNKINEINILFNELLNPIK